MHFYSILFFLGEHRWSRGYQLLSPSFMSEMGYLAHSLSSVTLVAGLIKCVHLTVSRLTRKASGKGYCCRASKKHRRQYFRAVLMKKKHRVTMLKSKGRITTLTSLSFTIRHASIIEVTSFTGTIVSARNHEKKLGRFIERQTPARYNRRHLFLFLSTAHAFTRVLCLLEESDAQ